MVPERAVSVVVGVGLAACAVGSARAYMRCSQAGRELATLDRLSLTRVFVKLHDQPSVCCVTRGELTVTGRGPPLTAPNGLAVAALRKTETLQLQVLDHAKYEEDVRKFEQDYEAYAEALRSDPSSKPTKPIRPTPPTWERCDEEKTLPTAYAKGLCLSDGTTMLELSDHQVDATFSYKKVLTRTMRKDRTKQKEIRRHVFCREIGTKTSFEAISLQQPATVSGRFERAGANVVARAGPCSCNTPHQVANKAPTFYEGHVSVEEIAAMAGGNGWLLLSVVSGMAAACCVTYGLAHQ